MTRSKDKAAKLFGEHPNLQVSTLGLACTCGGGGALSHTGMRCHGTACCPA
jgi:hypothetical protein